MKEAPITLNTEQVSTIRCELARLDRVMDDYSDLTCAAQLMGCDELANNIGKLALATGEISQAIFGTR